MSAPRLPPDDVRRLRSALLDAGYTGDGVLDAVGPTAYAALGRGERVPALRAVVEAGPTPLATLARLFLLQDQVAPSAAGAALPGLLDPLMDAGLLARDGPALRATVDVRPHAVGDLDGYVVSDLPAAGAGGGGPARPDHVLGVGGASTTLAQVTVRTPVGRALDLGTGCGVQALHLARHAGTVVATDRNRRALGLARLSAGLTGVALDLREGSLFEPVAGERFDLIVSNPPFVIAPSARFAYRDSGLPGDEVSRQLVTLAPAHLAEGGWCQVLANWLHVEGEDWRERLAGWVVPTGCDAWVVQRDVQDPSEYAELWLRDSGDHGTPAYEQRYGEWLDAFAADRVEGIGFGWVTLHRSGAAAPFVRIEDLRHPVRFPLGEVVREWFDRHDRLRTTTDADLLGLRLAVDRRVRLDEEHAPGPGAGVVRRVRQATGLCRSGTLDAVGAAVLLGCDGSRPLAAVLGEVAARFGLADADLREGALAAVRTLLEEGFLTAAAPGAGQPMAG